MAEEVLLHPDLSRCYFAFHPVSPIGDPLPKTCPLLRVSKGLRRHYLSILNGVLTVRGACRVDEEVDFLYTLEYVGYRLHEPGVRREMPYRWVIHLDGSVVGHVYPWTHLWRDTLRDEACFLEEAKRMMMYIWDGSVSEHDYSSLLEDFGVATGCKTFRRHLVHPLKRMMREVVKVDQRFTTLRMLRQG
tara:strand:+ start:698 stop:1264 length:567 start_codon:yes stop_codon:yes gene_type:complete